MPLPPPKPPLDARGLPPNYPFQPDWEVTPRDVKAMQEAKEDFVLIDCRKPDEYAVCKIDGAKLIPLQQLAAHVSDLEAIRDKKIIVHCHHGRRSLQMTMVLRQNGYEDVKSMAGGIDLWAVDVEPGIKRY